MRDLLGPQTVFLQCNGKKPVRPKWQALTVADMTEQYLKGLRGNIGALLGEASMGLCAIDLDSPDELPDMLTRNPGLRKAFRVAGRPGREKIFVRIVGAIPRGKTLRRNGLVIGEFLGTGSQAVIKGIYPEKGVGAYRVVYAGTPPTMAFGDIDFGALNESVSERPIYINRSASTENTALTVSNCINCITLHPLHNIWRR